MSEKKTVRINKFDNLKGLAIFLIVLGHMSFLTKYDSISFTHNFAFLFSLALFFFVSGYFTRIDENLTIKSIKRLLIPYILFTIIYWICYLPFGKASQMIFIYPSYALWFLLALFFMKMALPIMDRFSYPVLISFIFALLFGFVQYNGDILGLRRAFVFFPAFLIGFYFKNNNIELEKCNEILSPLLNSDIFTIFISVIVLIVSILVAYFLPLSAIMMKSPLEVPYLFNMLIRLLIIVLGIVITLILNRYMTNQECLLTKWGRNSMAVYLLHIYFIVILKKLTGTFLYQQNELLCLMFTFIASLLIVILLSRDIFTDFINILSGFFSDLIFKERG